MNKRKTATILTLVMVLAVLGGSEARAQACGDTILVSTTLTSSLTCTGPGLIVGADFITLDCSNLTITGSGTDIGILLSGRTGVTLQNCVVQNFSTGILLVGSTGNVVQMNGALNNTSTNGGFTLSGSDGNFVTNNRSGFNNGRGFLLTNSDGNIVLANNASNNSFRGYDFNNTSTFNFVVGNAALANTSAGFVTSGGATTNFFVQNRSATNSSEGWALLSVGNIVAFNDGSSNGTWGFRDTVGTGAGFIANSCILNGSGGSAPTPGSLCGPQP